MVPRVTSAASWRFGFVSPACTYTFKRVGLTKGHRAREQRGTSNKCCLLEHWLYGHKPLLLHAHACTNSCMQAFTHMHTLSTPPSPHQQQAVTHVNNRLLHTSTHQQQDVTRYQQAVTRVRARTCSTALSSATVARASASARFCWVPTLRSPSSS